MTVRQRHRSEASHTKGLLFCDRCDHRSPIDGDWKRDGTEPGLQLHCPRCGNSVIDQPQV